MVRAEAVDAAPPIRIITDDIFLSYSQCPYKAYLKLTGRTGSVSEYELSERDAFETYRSLGLQRALTGTLQKNVIDCAGPSISALPSGPSLLLHATLQTSNISSHIDVIEKVPRTNAYIPVLFSPSKTISSRDRLALGFRGVALSAVQGKEPQYGKIVYGSSFSVTRLKLQVISKKTRSVITALAKVVDGTSPPRLLLNRHCNTCEFQSDCRTKAIESDDISLIQTLKPKEIAKLNKKGIFTTTQYAFTFRPRRKRRKLSLPTKHDAALKALAIRDGRIYVNRVPPTEKRLAQVFLDVEGVPDEEFYYLIGLSVSVNGDNRFYSFWADDKAEEERIWKDFLGVLAGLGSSYWIFHFGSYETRFVAKMLKAYGSHSAITPEAITGSLRNVLTYYYLHVYVPTYSNSLKEVAAYFGFTWTSAVKTGLDSIIWRRRWDAHRTTDVQSQLTLYNREDCEALSLVTQAAIQIAETGSTDKKSVTPADDVKVERAYRWGPVTFAFPELEYVNKCAYFDYQRAKIYWRTSESVRKSIRRAKRRLRKYHIPNTTHFYSKPQACPYCKGECIEERRRKAESRTTYDLKFSASGAKRWLVRHLSHRYLCQQCGKTFLPADWPRGARGTRGMQYGKNLCAWVAYQFIGLGQSQHNIVAELADVFGFVIPQSRVATIKEQVATEYLDAYEELERDIRMGNVVHVDETTVSVKGAIGYVWVFSGIENVVYIYADSREGDILGRVLKDFSGVLVSDFYAAYESVPCAQQRCLIHLIRDLNDDLFKNPFDQEYKALVEAFGRLLKSIMETVDQRGLKTRFLRKHKTDVARFFRETVAVETTSDLARKYQTRLRKNEGQLFTFLDHDGVPWNNNNAENAIKAFAKMRQKMGGSSTEKGLKESLRLLSIAQTLRNKNVSFLSFLRSGKKTIGEYLGE